MAVRFWLNCHNNKCSPIPYKNLCQFRIKPYTLYFSQSGWIFVALWWCFFFFWSFLNVCFHWTSTSSMLRSDILHVHVRSARVSVCRAFAYILQVCITFWIHALCMHWYWLLVQVSSCMFAAVAVIRSTTSATVAFCALFILSFFE